MNLLFNQPILNYGLRFTVDNRKTAVKDRPLDLLSNSFGE